eukprot:33867-Lingulodinium_polyedra.AAC.1
MTIALTSLDKAKEALQQLGAAEQLHDRALMAYLRTLQFRGQLGYRWMSKPDFVLWLLPEGAIASSSPGTPTTSLPEPAGSPTEANPAVPAPWTCPLEEMVAKEKERQQEL